jgi:hypothetical protein
MAQSLADYDYPRDVQVGLPSRTCRFVSLPTTIDWRNHVQWTKKEEEDYMGSRKTRYEIAYTPEATEREVSRVTHAYRTLAVNHVPHIALDIVQDWTTQIQADCLLRLFNVVKQVPVLGVHVDDLKDYAKGSALDASNSYMFRLDVKYDVDREEPSQFYLKQVQREQRAREVLDAKLGGPVDTSVLQTMPDLLLPTAPSSLLQGQSPPLKLTATPPAHMCVYSHDAVWVPHPGQREAWLRRHNYQAYAPHDQDRMIQQHGPRLTPHHLLTKISRDERICMNVFAARVYPDEHAKNATGARPFTRYPVVFRGHDKVKGKLAWQVARVCPQRCFALERSGNDDAGIPSTTKSALATQESVCPSPVGDTDPSTVPLPAETNEDQQKEPEILDVEDMGSVLYVSQGNPLDNFRLKLVRPNACRGMQACGKCRTLAPSILMRDDTRRIHLTYENHGSQTPDQVVERTTRLLESTYAVYAPPKDMS